MPTSATTTTPSPSCDRCAISAFRTATLALSAGLPPTTHSPGPLTNASITSVAASVAGSAADDVTATMENTHTCTEKGTNLCKVGTEGVKETPPVATLIIAISAVAPPFTAPTEGIIGWPPCEPSTATLGVATTLLPVVSIPMFTSVIKSPK